MKLSDLKQYIGSQADDRNATYNDLSYGKFLDKVFDLEKNKQKSKNTALELTETSDYVILPRGVN